MDDNTVTDITVTDNTLTHDGTGQGNDTAEQVEQVEELLVEEISIDGMCGVY